MEMKQKYVLLKDLIMRLTYDLSLFLKNDLMLNMTPDSRSKTFQTSSKARLSSLTPNETIVSTRSVMK